MRCVAVGFAVAFVFAGRAQAQLSSPQQLRAQLDGKLLKPLPRVQGIVGTAIPPPAPLLVVASFSDDEAAVRGDRGYAVGRALNDLLFGVDRRLDVEAPSYYFTDVLDIAVPTGGRRDSRANALRVAVRESAQWCVYGNVRGSAPTVIDAFVSRCGEDAPRPTVQITINQDEQWPQAMQSVCEAVSVAAGIAKVGAAVQGCGRALNFRPGSLLAYAEDAASGKNATAPTLEAIVNADPAFTPALLELLWRLPYDGNKGAFLARARELTALARSSPAATLVGLTRQLELTGWKIGNHPYDELCPHPGAPQLRALWFTLASKLSEGTTWDYPPDPCASPWPERFAAATTPTMRPIPRRSRLARTLRTGRMDTAYWQNGRCPALRVDAAWQRPLERSSTIGPAGVRSAHAHGGSLRRCGQRGQPCCRRPLGQSAGDVTAHRRRLACRIRAGRGGTPPSSRPIRIRDGIRAGPLGRHRCRSRLGRAPRHQEQPGRPLAAYAARSLSATRHPFGELTPRAFGPPCTRNGGTSVKSRS